VELRMDDRLSDAIEYGFPRRLVTALLFGLAGVFAVLLFIPAGDKGKGTIAICSFASALLAVFWPLVAKVESIKIGPTGVGLSKKVDEANVKAEIADTKADAALATLTRFVFNSMPQPTFNNLRKIAGSFGTFGMSEGFRGQLRYLRDSGYIQTNGIAIADIPAEGNDLSNFVCATDLGKEFIAQRLAVEDAAQQSKVAATRQSKLAKP
jgi:hypothetical protein